MLENLAPMAVQLGMQVAQNQINKNWQEKMYNQYQSPQAMVRQYKEAGLNPALMYGENLQSQFNQPASQNQLDPIGSAYMAAQVKNMNANTENINADTRLKEIEGEFKPDVFRQNLARGWIEYDNTLAGIHKIKTEIEESSSRTNLNNIASKLTLAQIDNVLADTDKKIIESANEKLRSEGIKNNNRLLAAQIVTEQMKPALSAMEIALMQSQKYNYDAQTGEIGERISGIKLDNLHKDWERIFREQNGYEPSKPLWNTATTVLGRITSQVGGIIDNLPFSALGGLEFIRQHKNW